jgi:hypothetical protein
VPGDHEDRRVRGDSRDDGADGVDDGVDDQQGLPPEVVREGACQQGTRRRPERRPGDPVPLPEPREVIRDEIQRRTDVRGVVPEQKAAQRGEKREISIERRRKLVVEVLENVPNPSPPGSLPSPFQRSRRTTPEFPPRIAPA